MRKLDLPNGNYELPPGKLANLVTCLEMLENPRTQRPVWPADMSLRKFGPADLDAHRTLFRSVGANYLWFSRLIMSDERLAKILSSSDYDSYALLRGEEPIGLLDLDFMEKPTCELAFFGLAPSAVGTGLGKLLMQEAKARAWEKPITRFWVHTCHYDHPRALPFYQVSGFKPYSLMVEVHDDPRLSGHLPPEMAPHVALLKP